MTTHPINRRYLALTIAGLALALVAGVAWINLSAPKGVPIPWHLTGMGMDNGKTSDPQINDPLHVRIYVNNWPSAYQAEDYSWLAESVDETSSAVTITLRLSPEFPRPSSLPESGGWYDTGGWVNVPLHAPLGDRVLIDGATGQRVVPASSNP